jgi:hypothetical protein
MVKPDARATRLLFLSDFGPPQPIAPPAPPAPVGNIDDPAFVLAMVEFWPVMEAHHSKLMAYTAASIDYAEWHSRYGYCRETLEYPMDANVAIEADERAVASGKQSARRYHLSPRNYWS